MVVVISIGFWDLHPREGGLGAKPSWMVCSLLRMALELGHTLQWVSGISPLSGLNWNGSLWFSRMGTGSIWSIFIKYCNTKLGIMNLCKAKIARNGHFGSSWESCAQCHWGWSNFTHDDSAWAILRSSWLPLHGSQRPRSSSGAFQSCRHCQLFSWSPSVNPLPVC